MKRRFIILAAGLILPLAVLAGPRLETIKVTLTGAAVYAGTNTSSAIAGYIEDMQVTCSDGASTGVVAIVVQPKSSATAYNIATGTATASKLWRTSLDRTAVDGTALTSDPPSRVCLIGDTLSFQITASQASNVTWTLDLKMSDQ